MKPERQRNLQDLLVFFLLVAIGVAGRWGQPEWCFTPTAAAFETERKRLALARRATLQKRLHVSMLR